MKIAEHCEGEVILFGTEDAPPLRQHLEGGGRAVVTKGPDLLLMHGFRQERIDCPVAARSLPPPFQAAVAATQIFLGIS
jgi:hypothetical protein